ncbi:MAG: hypothetical protein ACREOG_05140 [Gemmatimonadaceae bacterium]
MRLIRNALVHNAGVVGLALAFVCCNRERASDERGQEGRDTSVASSGDSVRIVNRLWQVTRSTAGAPGTLYAFLSDGTLLITSAHGTPLVGSWSYVPGTLTLVEEGIAHPATILQSSEDELTVRSTNPGGTVEITLVRARAGRVQ